MTKAVHLFFLFAVLSPAVTAAVTGADIQITTTGSGSIHNTTSASTFGSDSDVSTSVFVRNVVGNKTKTIEISSTTTPEVTSNQVVTQESVDVATTEKTQAIDSSEESSASNAAVVEVEVKAFGGWFERFATIWKGMISIFWR